MSKIINFNIPNSCLEENTYEEVLSIIKNHSNELECVISVIEEFIEESRKKQERLSILIAICNILPIDNPYYLKYKGYIDAIYEMEIFNIEAYKKYLCDEETLKILQSGFYFIIEDYSGNNIAMEYLAKKFIRYILENNNINVEQELHRRFKKYEELEKFGITKYLISLINKYDTNLGSYIMCHIKVLDEIKEIFSSIKSNWNFYVDEQPIEYPKLKLVPKSKIDSNN